MSTILTPPTRAVRPNLDLTVTLRDLWAFKQCRASYHFRQELRKTKHVYSPPTDESQFVGDILHSAASASVESRQHILQKGLEKASKSLPQDRLSVVEKRCLDMLRWGDSVLKRDSLNFHYRKERLDTSSGIYLVTVFDAFQAGRVPTVIEFKSRSASKVSSSEDFQTMVSAWLMSGDDIRVVKRKILYFGSNTVIEDQFTRAELDNYMAQNVRPLLRKLAGSLLMKQNLAEQRSIGKDCAFCQHRAQCQANSI